MPETKDSSDRTLDLAQALELAVVVDLEARWENLRNPRSATGTQPTTQDLPGKQKAYEAFRAKLLAYNKRYNPAHVPELLLNTSVRLGKWCRAMRDVYRRVEGDSQARCPAHLLEKAYRWADQVAGRMTKAPISRPTAPPENIPAAIRDLEALILWCDELTAVVPARLAAI